MKTIYNCDDIHKEIKKLKDVVEGIEWTLRNVIYLIEKKEREKAKEVKNESR